MAIDKDIKLEGQQPIPTHPADPHAHSDDDKVVGEEVLQTPDYNAPPSEGAIKSTGAAADPGVGGASDALPLKQVLKATVAQKLGTNTSNPLPAPVRAAVQVPASAKY